MATISPTQLTYLARISDAAVDGLVPAKDVFDKLRASKLSISLSGDNQRGCRVA